MKRHSVRLLVAPVDWRHSYFAAGCSHAQYQRELSHVLGMQAVSASRFYKTLELMHPHVKSMVDEQCKLAKREMKQKPLSELGIFQNAVMTADGAWLTRCHHSQNLPIRLEITWLVHCSTMSISVREVVTISVKVCCTRAHPNSQRDMQNNS